MNITQSNLREWHSKQVYTIIKDVWEHPDQDYVLGFEEKAESVLYVIHTGGTNDTFIVVSLVIFV